jgi:hypothetical protein
LKTAFSRCRKGALLLFQIHCNASRVWPIVGTTFGRKT